MKAYPSRLLMALAATFLLLAAIPVHAATLSLQATSNGSDVAAVFPVGSPIYLNVLVSDPSGIAGVAFTVTYDAAFATPPGINAEGLPVNVADITSIFPFSYLGTEPDTDTFRANGSTTGKIYLSGAAINETNGGPLYTAGAETVLFTIKFMVREDAVIDGTFSFGLEQTQLFNPAAGYGTDAGNDGSFDIGVDTKDPVPVLVGAVDKDHVNFGGDLSDDFPVLMASLSPLSSPTLTVDPPPYEDWKTINGWSAIGDPNADYDQDGYSNTDEYNNRTNPTAKDTAGGNGYDPVTDERVDYFTGVHTGPESLVFYGDSVTIDGEDAIIGDEVGVYTSDGILCGSYKLTENGQYTVTVYGDDPATAGVKDGATAGEVLTFKVLDRSEGRVITVSGTMYQPAAVFGSISASPHNPPQWTANNDQWGLNIQITSEEIIPLQAGWNLISFSVNKVYHDTDDQPTVATLTNSVFEKVSSIGEVLASIDGKYKVIRSFDAAGAHTYDPNLPAFLNDLHYLAAGYGYWIYMTEAANLQLNGARAQASDSMALNSGWNLIGCWHSAVQYDSDAEPTAAFADGMTKIQIGSIGNAFATVDGFYSVIRSFDANGAHTFDPNLPAFLNDMHYVAPGYGYWIYTTASKSFNY